MTGFGWQTQASGLKLREDAFSWQGAFEGDARFFLRRSKYRPQEFSDLLFGNLDDDHVERLLAEFIAATGGIVGERLIFIAISVFDENHKQTVTIFDRTTRIGKNVAVLLGRLSKDSHLDQDGNKWNAVLQLHPQEL